MYEIKSYKRLLTKFDKRKKELLDLSEQGVPIFAYHCLFVPKEIITATGAGYVELPWLAKLYGCKEDQYEASEKNIPYSSESFCSLCRWNFITGLREPHPKVDMVIGITTCAPLIKIVSMLPKVNPEFSHLHIMNLPRRLEEEVDMEHWLKEIKGLKELVEDITKIRITDERLEKEIIRENHLRMLLRAMLEIRRTDPIPIKSSEAALVADLAFVLDTQVLVDGLEEIMIELRQRKKSGIHVYPEGAPRLMLTGPTLYDRPDEIGVIHEPSIIKLIEDLGGAPVAEDFCAGIRLFWSPIPYSDDLLRLIANHYANVLNCACQTPNIRRIDQCIPVAVGSNIDGVIYINMQTCKIFAAEIKKIEEIFVSLGFPFLYIERTGDFQTEQFELLKDQIEPFIHTLKEKKKSKGRRKYG